jgi:hypothetical protein
MDEFTAELQEKAIILKKGQLKLSIPITQDIYGCGTTCSYFTCCLDKDKICSTIVGRLGFDSWYIDIDGGEKERKEFKDKIERFFGLKGIIKKKHL